MLKRNSYTAGMAVSMCVTLQRSAREVSAYACWGTTQIFGLYQHSCQLLICQPYCHVKKRLSTTTWIPYTESCKNINARFRDWLAEMLRHSAIVHCWGGQRNILRAEHFEGDSRNVAGICLHNSVECRSLTIWQRADTYLTNVMNEIQWSNPW